MQIESKNINENQIGLFVVLGTLGMYHLLSIETNIIPGLFHYLPRMLVPPIFLISPGVVCGCIFAIFTRNIFKILFAGIVTIILWIYWFSAVFPALIH